MPFREAKEHAPGRLHDLLDAPYGAFGNEAVERRRHLDIALEALLARPLENGRLTLRVIHGWENGDFEPEALRHSDHPATGLETLTRVQHDYQQARERQLPLPHDDASLLAAPLAAAIARAEQSGLTIDAETRRIPARWPAFPQGLSLYTFFKVYHRLTYGEDDYYRSIRCETPEGPREIHEFHLEEGEFAVCTPPDPDSDATTLLIMHESQLDPMAEFLESYSAHIA